MSRMSLERPEIPSRPDFLLQMFSISSTEMWSLLQMYCTTAGSITPERVPMIMPSKGVMPMEVSTHLP